MAVSDRQTYKDNSSIVRVSNTNYKTFKSFKISKSIDGVCGEFDIVISRPVVGDIPLKSGDVIDIQLDDVQVMRGKIYETTLEGDAGTDNIVFSGRDITGDLIDSTVPDSAKVYDSDGKEGSGISILTIANSIIAAKGMTGIISVIDGTESTIRSFNKDEIVSCKMGWTVVKFLHDYCRKRQLFLNTDEYGNLVFFKAKGIVTGNNIINNSKNNNNNVTSYKVKNNISKRFYKYICKTQSTTGWASLNVDAQGIAYDPDISKYREYEFKIEENTANSATCRAWATEESNVRRARAFEYSVTVQGFGDKVMWATNQLVNVSDDKAGVYGVFLIKRVEYALDSIRGRTTKLIITNSDAYTAQAAIDARRAKKQDILWGPKKS